MDSTNKAPSVTYSKRGGYGRGRGTTTHVQFADGRRWAFVGRLGKAEAVREALRQPEAAR